MKSEDQKPLVTPSDGLHPGERPTLKTIARLSGLAVPTVSRALSDAPDIGKQTKLRVREIAQSIGYRPNRAGLRLRTGKTQVIAVILSTEHDVSNQTAILIESIAAGLRDTGYHLVVTPFFPDEDPMHSIKYVVETGAADGIIFNSTEPDDARIHYLQKLNFPFACHGRSAMADTHAWSDFDHREFGRKAVQKFAEKERKKMLIISPRLELNYARDLVECAKECSVEFGIEVLVMEDVHASHLIDKTEAVLANYWIANAGIDAILCASTSSAYAVIAHLDKLNLEIGQDLDVIVREFIPLLKRFRPSLISVSEDVAAAGDFLAKAVLHRIAEPDQLPMQTLETPTFSE